MVGGEAAAGDNAVQVRMVKHLLAPGMEHGEEADGGAEVLRVGGNRQ